MFDDDRPLQRRFVALLVVEGDRPAAELVEALERVDQVPEEGVAAHLAVGDDVEPGGFLQRDGFVDGAVLDALERGGVQLATLERVLAVAGRPAGAGCQ